MIQAHVKAQHSSPLVHCAFTSVSRKSKTQTRKRCSQEWRCCPINIIGCCLLLKHQGHQLSSLSNTMFAASVLVHMKASNQMNEVETVEKAIRSGTRVQSLRVRPSTHSVNNN